MNKLTFVGEIKCQDKLKLDVERSPVSKLREEVIKLKEKMIEISFL